MELFDSAEYENCAARGTPESLLASVFGYPAFRPLQREIIGCVLERRDTLAVLPTGGGKSLCCQIPALIFPGLTVMVSPLIALMQDQVAALRRRGVPAAVLSTGIGRDAYIDTLRMVRAGNIKLLYLSPEALATDRIRELLTVSRVDCIAVDEAHCISEWGHDFRPDYRAIAQIRQLLPRAVCLALTATATEQVRQDIVKNLSFRNPRIFVGGFDRANIFLEVQAKIRPMAQILEFLRDHEQESGIIYCFSRRQVDELTAELCSAHLAALPYHAGLDDRLRARNQQRFIQGDIKIMVATVAFGMGIDKADVRFVIHYDMPKSLEQYYQEIGRAGRDGKPAQALLLYSSADIHKIRYFMQDMDDGRKAAAERLVQGMISYAESKSCRRQILLDYFGSSQNNTQQHPAPECCCDNCRGGTEAQTDITSTAAKLLTAIRMTGQRFGIQYVADVLTGSHQQRILDNGHDTSAVWGSGRELSKNEWCELARFLLAQQLIKKSPDYGVLSLTRRGYAVCAGTERVSIAQNAFSREPHHSPAAKQRAVLHKRRNRKLDSPS